VDASAVIAIVAAVIAAASAVATFLQVRLAIRQTELQQQVREDAAQPYVFVDFRMDTAQAALVSVLLENRGPTVATKVRVSWTPELPEQQEVTGGAREAPRTLPSMPPGRSMSWTVGLGRQLLNDETVPTEYVVTVEADGPFGPVPPLRYTLSLSDMRLQQAIPQGSLDRVERAITDAAKQLSS